jgi:CBS domain-containing protein
MAETDEYESEEVRLKILRAQDEANKRNSGENGEHHVNEEEPAPNDDRLRVDQIQSQEGRVLNTGAMGGVSSVRPVSAAADPVHFADALEQWRYMSEKYRDQRLAREKAAKPGKTDAPQVDLFSETDFQHDYENDMVSISGTKEKKYKEQEKILQRLSSANLEIVPELIVEPEELEIEPQNGILTVADVMTKDVISVIDSMTIEQVASIFNKKKITGVPVVNYHTKELTGLISMSDIISHLFEGGMAFALHEENNALIPETLTIMDKKVSDLMKTNILRVSATSSIKDACNLMLENHIHRVLVTKNNRVQGIFTSYDAVRILAKFDVKIE